MRLPVIVKARNDLLHDEEGHRVIDLFSANGAAWLGHCNPLVSAAVAAQMKQVWIAGGLGTLAAHESKLMVEKFIPASHSLAGLYSTGMEAAEFAIRIARFTTGRNEIVGFERSMHGKSMATAYLGWDNQDGLNLPDLHRVPFPGARPEPDVLRSLEEVLRPRTVAAVFVEPLQGSGGGHMASTHFFEAVMSLCQEYGSLAVFDEILTGFYRTGKTFMFCGCATAPSIILIGKGIGNGFPVSGVVTRRDIPITPRMLPGSTFAGNPLAGSAVAATLRQMLLMDLPEMIAEIERTVTGILGEVRDRGVALRGKGALWILELPEMMDIDAMVERIYRKGVLVGYTRKLIRVLPAATIRLQNLAHGCQVVRDELFRTDHG